MIFLTGIILLLAVGFMWFFYYKQRNIYKNLWETSEEFRTTLYSIGDGVITTDVNGRIKNLNPIAEQITGWKESEAKNKPLKDVFRIINEETRNKVENPVQKVLKEGLVVGLANHTILISKDGKEIPIANSGAPVKNEKGEIIGFVLVFNDQTEERSSVKALQKSESFIRTVLDNLPIGIAVNSVDPSVAFSYMNDNFVKHYRTSKEALANPDTFWDAVYEDSEFREKMKKKVLDDCASGNPEQMHWEDIPIMRKGNDTKYISARNIPLPDKKLAISTVWDVTERKLAEKSLKESEERYRLLVDNSLDAVLLTAPDGRIFSANKAAEEIFERSEEEICRLGRNGIIDTDDPRLKAALEERILKGKFHGELNGLRKDGSKFPIEVTSALFEDPEGNLRTSMIIRDISERKQAEEKIQSFFRAAPVGIGVVVNRVFTEVNERFCEMIGYSKEELIRQSARMIYATQEDFEYVGREKYNQIAASGLGTVETRFKCKSGNIIDVLLSSTPIDPADHTKGIIFSTLDVTERKMDQKVIQESEERLRLIANNMSDVLLISDLNQNIIYTSPSIFKLLGYTPKEALKIKLEKILTPESFQFVQKILAEELKREINGVVDENRTRKLELENIRKDGSKIWVEVVASFLRDKDKRPVNILTVTRDITDRRIAENAMVQSEKRYRHLFEHNPHPMLVYDEETLRILAVNDTAIYKYGYSKDELLNMNISDIGVEDEKEKLSNYISKDKSEIRVSGPWKQKLKNGKIILVEISSHRINFLGKKSRLISINDITEKYIAEEALRQSEEKYRKIFDEDLTGDFISTADGKLLLCNPALVKILGFDSIESLMKVNLKDVYPTLDERETFLRLLKEKHKLELYEHHLKRRDGKIIAVIENAIGEFNEKGELLSLKGYIFDITERREAEQNLRKLSRGIEQSPVIVVITDAEGNIEYVNPKFTEVTGYYSEEVVGSNPRILSSREKTKSDYKELWDTILSGKVWRGEFHNKKKNGDLYWEAASVSPIFNELGKITHFIAVKEDITKQIQMVNELVAAKENAEEMNRLKSYFFANMSHELRTPFIGIQGFAELLLESVEDSEAKHMVNGILESSKRLTDTLDKILSLSKLEFESVEIQNTSVDVTELLHDSYVLFHNSAESKGLSFVFKGLKEHLTIKSDEKILIGIITNLINNAVKYTRKGKIELNSYVEDRKGKEYLIIKVSDTGIGIPKEKQDQIWMAFRQVSEGLNRSFEGVGLGLTITRKYVELLGGTISLESELDRGSTFTVELPIERFSITPVKEVKPKQKQIEKNLKPKIISKKLLYVEDDVYSQMIVSKVLSKQYKVDVVQDAVLALEKIIVNRYDILLIDINLGHGMDGLQLMEKIRGYSGYQKIPIIAVTSYASENDRDEFLSKGFTSYISKPFMLKDLVNLVNEIFNKN